MSQTSKYLCILSLIALFQHSLSQTTQRYFPLQPLYKDDYYFLYSRSPGRFNYTEFRQNAPVDLLLAPGVSKVDNRTFRNEDQEHYMTVIDGQTSQQVGYAMFRRPISVKYGFESRFKVRVRWDHTRMTSCGLQSDCSDRDLDKGDLTMPRHLGDGFAFVISSVPFERESLPRMAGGGSALGYGGMKNAVAVEFDLYENEDKRDPNDAHVAVQFAGSEAVSSTHSTTFKTKIAPDYGSILQYGDNYTMYLLQSNRSKLTPAEQADYDVASEKVKLFLWSDPLTSLVNYIYPNVTPAFNWADIGSMLDSEIHDVRIRYNASSHELEVFIDAEEEPTLSVVANLSKLILNEDYLCKHYNGCFTRKDYFFNETERIIYERPICQIFRYEDKKAPILLFSSNVTSDRNGLPYILDGPKGPSGCQECFGFEGCTAYVTLVATSGTIGPRIELFSWSFTSDGPKYDTVEFDQGEVPRQRR